ncbi:MAG: tRNA (adenosine(37)-N6)-threonylcarbamoyltransferase complex ATPase subunit type 1 TsaE [Devosia sp.]
MTRVQTIFLPDDAATADLGRRLAAILRPGDLVLLSGGLGAGKTALARSVVRALVGDDALEVPSPSFALVQPYEAGTLSILHADLYRLVSEREIDELGLFDRADSIVLVEWPERAAGLRAKANVVVEIAIPKGGAGRAVTIQARDGRQV